MSYSNNEATASYDADLDLHSVQRNRRTTKDSGNSLRLQADQEYPVYDEQHGEGSAKSLDNINDFYPEEDPILSPLPNSDVDMISAKAFLQKPSSVDGVSLYDHLSDILEKVLTERPRNVIDFFEEYSRKMKEARFQPQTDHLQDVFIPPWEFGITQKLLPLFQSALLSFKDRDNIEEQEVMGEGGEDEEEEPQSDMMEMLSYFEQAGVGLPRNEMFCVALSIRKLSLSKIIQKIRFWGKIIGTEKNYYVAETELTEEEYTRRNEEAEALAAAEEAEAELEPAPEPMPEPVPEPVAPPPVVEAVQEGEVPGEGAEAVDVVPPIKIPPFPVYPIPKSLYKPPVETPVERCGEGANKKVFYVCHEIGDEWIELPDLTPKHIVVARKIKKIFTGDLDKEIHSFPPFAGTERNYLRAQIARISAGTHISPLGFYTFGGGEEEEEVDEEAEGGAQTNYTANPNYEVLPLNDLIDVSMNYWVHHSMYILKQGRTVWWNPSGKGGGDGEEEMGEEEEDEGEGGAGAEREVGPPLLTPLSEDSTIESTAPWTTRAGSALMKNFAAGVVRSNIWPGACAFAVGKKIDNIYIGNGVKYVAHNYSPPGMEQIQYEYPTGPEIMEILDPTPEEEEAWRIAHLPKPKPEVTGEEEEAPGEEEEEEEDDDDE